MDDTAKKIFKMKFFKLVFFLNADVFLFFLSGLLFLFLPGALRIILSTICLIIAIIFGVFIFRRYRETKEWLQKNQ